MAKAPKLTKQEQSALKEGQAREGGWAQIAELSARGLFHERTLRQDIVSAIKERLGIQTDILVNWNLGTIVVLPERPTGEGADRQELQRAFDIIERLSKKVN